VKKPKIGAVEQNIYCEERSGSLRFVVQVSPLPKSSATFDISEFKAGLAWAKRKRGELRAEKVSKSGGQSQMDSGATHVVAAFTPVVQTSRQGPGNVVISDIIGSYRVKELYKLASVESTKSRLNKLDEWFGRFRLGELTREEIESWRRKREDGRLGTGRARIPPPTEVGSSVQTKHERAKARKEGVVVPKLLFAPVSSQTIRHELVLLRRAVSVYFQDEPLEVGAWIAAHPLLRVELPAPAAARKVRIGDDDFGAMKAFLSPMQIAFVLVAMATTLRRAEICSLCWEDVNFARSEVLLRAPGHRNRTKTNERQVPLLPAVADVLHRLGPKKSGRIFEITPSGISQALRRAADRAGLRDIRLHDTRREAVSRLIELFNASLQTVIAFSGHTSEDALQRHYVNPHASRVAERLGAHPMAAKMIPAT
jgi:integrase